MIEIPEHTEGFYVITVKALQYFVRDVYITLFGLLSSFIGYMLPIQNIVHSLILFFILDVIFGYWAARKIKKEKFSAKIIWEHTMPRLLMALVIITCAFVWDKEYKQDFISTPNLIGWFISGVLLVSITDNAYQITKWNAFPQLSKVFKDKTKERTGLDIEDESCFFIF